MEDWEYMRSFAFDLIKFSSSIRDEKDIIKQRIIIMLLDQATELLMKSFLLKNSIIEKSKRISFKQCLEKINAKEEDKQKILHFRGIRNEIQHRALKLEEINKPREIIVFFSALKSIYNLMFQEDNLPPLIPTRLI